MRIRRIRLAHYRGVRAREVVLPPRNVTVIEGPNESGKSSLNEALDVILEYYDSSKATPVQDLKPTHEDAGTEIEVDIEAGEYSFTYFKRFHKKPQTLLTVHRPQTETHTGRDAHARVLEILGTSVDLGLWRALRIQQGLEVDLPQLAENPSLARALDEAAGQASIGEREQGLLQAVEDEYQRYFTPREGQPSDLVRRAAQRRAEAAERASELEHSLAIVEADAEAAAHLQRDVATLDSRRQAQARETDELHRAQIDAERLRAEVEQRRRASDAASSQLRQARDERSRRDEQAANLAELSAEVARHHRDRDDRAPTLDAARSKLELAELALRKRTASLQAARETFEEHRRRLEGLRDERERADLTERIDRARALGERIATLERELGETPIDDAALARVRAAHDEWVAIDIRTRQAAPRIEIRAHRALTGKVNQRPLDLEAGDERELPQSPRTRIEIDGVLDLTVAPGAGQDTGEEARLRARAAYEQACREVHVEDVDGALEAHARVRQLAGEVELLREERTRTLGDTTLDELDARTLRLTKGAGRAPATEDIDAARAAADRAHAELERRERERQDAERECAGLREVRDKLEREHGRDHERIALLERHLRDQERQLDLARTTETDTALAERVAILEREQSERLAELTTAQRRLDERDPDSAETLAQNAAAVLERLDAELGTASTKRAEVQARIDVRIESGFHDALESARTDLHRLTLEHDSLTRRGAAARRLRDTLRRHRDAQLQSYRAPLRERIEKLGRLVFGPTFEVELDDQLRIVGRTLDGVPVPFRSLSVGTQEQLSIMARLACAMMVAPDGGVPVILDDILGYCDPDRLRAMGSMLAIAGRSCQVILLTCDPERGRQVGGANVVKVVGQ